jgi:hypothetical protein
MGGSISAKQSSPRCLTEIKDLGLAPMAFRAHRPKPGVFLVPPQFERKLMYLFTNAQP